MSANKSSQNEQNTTSKSGSKLPNDAFSVFSKIGKPTPTTTTSEIPATPMEVAPLKTSVSPNTQKTGSAPASSEKSGTQSNAESSPSKNDLPDIELAPHEKNLTPEQIMEAAKPRPNSFEDLLHNSMQNNDKRVREQAEAQAPEAQAKAAFSDNDDALTKVLKMKAAAPPVPEKSKKLEFPQPSPSIQHEDLLAKYDILFKEHEKAKIRISFLTKKCQELNLRVLALSRSTN